MAHLIATIRMKLRTPMPLKLLNFMRFNAFPRFQCISRITSNRAKTAPTHLGLKVIHATNCMGSPMPQQNLAPTSGVRPSSGKSVVGCAPDEMALCAFLDTKTFPTLNGEGMFRAPGNWSATQSSLRGCGRERGLRGCGNRARRQASRRLSISVGNQPGTRNTTS